MDIRADVLSLLRAAPRQTLFVSQLTARLSEAGSHPGELDSGLSELAERGLVVVTTHQAPDRHLADMDLRTVALIASAAPEATQQARERTAAAWDEFLRRFLAAHRCG